MHIYLSIAFTLLALVAGMYLLAKSRAENLGKLFRFVSWLVIIMAGLSLTCQVTRGVCYMACRTGICTPSEHCMPGMMHKGMMQGMSGECNMRSGCGEEECCESRSHGDGMSNCCKMGGMKGEGDCCKGHERKGGCMEEEVEGECHGMKKDSLKGK